MITIEIDCDLDLHSQLYNGLRFNSEENEYLTIKLVSNISKPQIKSIS